MVEHHKTGSFDVLVQVFFQHFGAVNEFLFSHGAVMKYFFFIWCTNECIILLGAVKKLIISFGALTAVISTTTVTLIGCC
jgi:hypothetical protein